MAVSLLEKPFIWFIEIKIEKFAPYCPWLIVFSAVERLRPCINTTIQSHITMQPVLCRLPFAKKFVFVCGIQNTWKFLETWKKNIIWSYSTCNKSMNRIGNRIHKHTCNYIPGTCNVTSGILCVLETGTVYSNQRITTKQTKSNRHCMWVVIYI